MNKLKVGDIIRLKCDGTIVTVQEMINGSGEEVGFNNIFWSDRLPSPWYKCSETGVVRKNWHNGSELYVEVVMRKLIKDNIKKHELI